MKKKILFTGLTGKTGRYSVERLQERRDELSGLRLVAAVRPTSDCSVIEQSGLPIEIVRGDLTNDAFLASVMQGVDTLLHIVGIHTSERVVSAAMRAGVRRCILVHTTGIYSKYKSASADYIEIDRRVTELCRANGAVLTILRPTMIYGGVDDENVVKFIGMMDRFPVMPTVSGARFELQPVHRADLGKAYVDVLLDETDTGNKNYDLSGAKPITLREMLTVIAGYLGKTPRFFSVPYPIAIAGAWALYVASVGKKDYREKVMRLVEPRAYPHDAATRDFGYAPVGFAEGVADEVVQYLSLRGKK